MFFSDMGIAYGLVQKKEIAATDIRFAFTWQWLLGLSVTLILGFLSGPLATFFHEPRAQGVIAVLALVCFFQSAASVSTNLLRRDLKQKAIQFCYAFSYFVGYVLIGIPLAIYGAQVWSLVVAWIVQACLSFLILYRLKRHPIKPLIWHGEAVHMSQYGATVLITNLVNWVISTVDRLIIGRLFPVASVGIYATAYNLMSYSTSTMYSVVQSVFFSAGGHIQGDRTRLTRAFSILLEIVTLIALPIFVCVATISGTFILALYGSKWRAASDVLLPIALAMPFFLVWGMTTPVLWSSGRERKEFIMQLPLAVLWAAACFVAAHYSVVAVAWTVFLLSILRAFIFVIAAQKHLDLGFKELLYPWLRGGMLSAAMCLVTIIVDSHLSRLPPQLTLLCDMATATTIGWAALRWLPGLLSSALISTVSDFSARMSPKTARALHFLIPREVRS